MLKKTKKQNCAYVVYFRNAFVLSYTCGEKGANILHLKPEKHNFQLSFLQGSLLDHELTQGVWEYSSGKWGINTSSFTCVHFLYAINAFEFSLSFSEFTAYSQNSLEPNWKVPKIPT